VVVLAAALCFPGLRVPLPARAETLLVVPPIRQTFWPADQTGRTFDVGRFDCVPAAVAMDLQALAREGLLAPSVPTDYPTIRRVFRTYFPRASQGIVPLAVPGIVAALSRQTLQAQLVRLARDSWRSFLVRELSAGRPVVVVIGDWSRLAGHWYPGGVTHAVIVTGLQDGYVFYNDPWDGKSYFMTESAFAAAWGTTPNAWLALPIRPTD
jgi:hypothetical protein